MGKVQKSLLLPYYKYFAESAVVHIQLEPITNNTISQDKLNNWHTLWVDMQISPVIREDSGIISRMLRVGNVVHENDSGPLQEDTSLAIKAYAEICHEDISKQIMKISEEEEIYGGVITSYGYAIITAVEWHKKDPNGVMVTCDEDTWSEDFFDILDDAGVQAQI